TVTVLDPAASASVSIVSDDANNEICNGENLTFTATPVDGGATPIYEWFIDGISQGTNSPTFTPITPLTVGTHDIYVEIQSSLSACVLPKQSNTITVTVHPAPTVTAPVQICMGDTGNLTPNSGGTWVSNNPAVATVTNAGVITPVAPGNVTFTFTSASTSCPSTTNNVVINALPNITNLPSNNDICVNESHTLSPTTGGTWTSNNNAIATITNGGVITGISPGNVTFTFTNTATGCSSTTPSIEVLDIPVINSVTASPDTVCAGEDSVLTVEVDGGSLTAETIVNYNFNSGNNYNVLDGQEVAGITSDVYSNLSFDRTQSGIAGGAFTANPAGTALRQLDNHQDGNNGLGGTPDNGNWRFDLGGSNLPNYQDFRVFFQARRMEAQGGHKRVRLDYRVNGGAWVVGHATRGLPVGNTNWLNLNVALPTTGPNAVTNPNDLEIRLQVNDNSDYDFGDFNCHIEQVCLPWPFNFICWNVEVCDDYGAYNIAEPHVLIDNFQVQASTSGESFEYAWSVDPGAVATAGLPASAETPSSTNRIITVNPLETTEYTVTVTNEDGCPATETVTVNVFPVPELTIVPNYCPPPPNENYVQLDATSTGFVSYEWNTG